MHYCPITKAHCDSGVVHDRMTDGRLIPRTTCECEFWNTDKGGCQIRKCFELWQRHLKLEILELKIRHKKVV